MSRDEVMSAALDLSREDRAALAERLWASLDDEPDADIEALWIIEAERRLDEILAGRVTPIPREEALARIQKALG